MSKSANCVQALLQQAIGLHQAGQLDQAGPLYQQILALAPRQPDALHLQKTPKPELDLAKERLKLLKRHK